jgi:hypothetical protein
MHSTWGYDNTFVGSYAGNRNTTGIGNSFFGFNAGRDFMTGENNTFVGKDAAFNSTGGNNNIAIGNSAGSNLQTGSNNIYLANAGADESNTIRIGTQNTQTSAFMAGINNTQLVNGLPVVVDPTSGQLGVSGASSLRFKKDIRDMGNASNRLTMLRPVTFYYRPELVKGEQTLQYGLIAEEVAKVYPELVQYAPNGQVQAVRYNLLSTMLLNEMQKQQRLILSQKQRLQTQAQHISNQERQLQSQTQQINDVEMRLRRLEGKVTRHQRPRRK